MFKFLTFVVFFAALAWVFVGFCNLAMPIPAIATAVGMFVVVWEAASQVSDALTYWDSMR